MKLKIVSEGTGSTTKIVDAETDKEVEGIIGIEISMDSFNIEAAIIISDPILAIDNLQTREIRQGDSEWDDGTTSNPDN
jgi:hypothetical protein